MSEKGQCLHCKSDDIDYSSLLIQDDFCCYPWNCNKCGSEGMEYYDLMFNKNELKFANDYRYDSYILYPSCSEERVTPKDCKHFEKKELQKLLGGYVISCRGTTGELILHNMDAENKGEPIKGNLIYGKALIINNKALYR